jgi:hypothetical protein
MLREKHISDAVIAGAQDLLRHQLASVCLC